MTASDVDTQASQAGSLLEREAELERIDGALRTARHRAGSLVVIEGPAGIGKTELVIAARRRAGADEMAVGSARGSELERELAYGVVRQLLEPMVAAADPEARADLFAGAAALAEPLFAPSATPGASAGQPRIRRSPCCTGCTGWRSNLAQRRPLLLAVDDAHWADLAWLRFLAYLAQRREGHGDRAYGATGRVPGRALPRSGV